MLAATAQGEVGGSGPLTVVAAWKVKPGKEAAFEEWHRGLSAEASKFPGHLGVSVMRQPAPSGEYLVIFKFDSYENLVAWQESPVRQEWLKKAESLRADEVRYQSGYGLEFWFTSPLSGKYPPRWKMALISMLAIYPLVNLLNIILTPLIAGLSPWVGGLVATPIIILLMTYLVMPFMTRIFSRWLFSVPPEVQS